MKKRQIVVVHGGEVFKDKKDFHAWLQKEYKVDPYTERYPDWKADLPKLLPEDLYDIIYVSLPNKLDAKYEEWKVVWKKYLKYLRPGAIIVGHSLGGTFLLKYFSENTTDIWFKAIMLVATPMEAGTFSVKKPLKIRADFHDLFIYHCKDDEVVPIKDSPIGEFDKNVYERVYKTGGHLIDNKFMGVAGDILLYNA